MNDWLLIILMALITFSIRYLMLATSGRWSMPLLLEQAVKYVPVAVLTAITVQTLLVKSPVSGSLSVNFAFLFSAIVAFIASRLFNSLMTTVIIGLTFYWGYTTLGGF